MDPNLDHIGYFDRFEPFVEVRGGYVPHWRQEGVTYFVTSAWQTAFLKKK
jgi:hypothetical protein